MTELPPSIIVDDHGTVKHAVFVRVGGGNAVYRIVDEPKLPQPATRLEADMGRALDLINKAFGS